MNESYLVHCPIFIITEYFYYLVFICCSTFPLKKKANEMLKNILLNPLGFKNNSFQCHFIASANFSLVIGIVLPAQKNDSCQFTAGGAEIQGAS